MCVIIDRPAGVPIAEKILKTALNDNPDGWGWMFAQDDELICDWGMDDKDFFESYKNLPDDVHATLHFRWTTHGLTNVLNCHPFLINNDEYGIVHNGVIQVNIKYKELSDTYHFCNGDLSEALNMYGHAFGGQQHKRMRKYLEHVVGSHNKLVILRKDGERMFLNRKAGVTHEGLWLSNSGPLTAPMSESSKWARRYRKSGGTGTSHQWADDDYEGVGASIGSRGYYGGYSGGSFTPKKSSDSTGTPESKPTKAPNLFPLPSVGTPPPVAEAKATIVASSDEVTEVIPTEGHPSPTTEVTEEDKKWGRDFAARMEAKSETSPALVATAVSAALGATNPVDADYAFRLERIEQEKYERAQARLRAQAEDDDEMERVLIEHYMKRNDDKEEEEAMKDYITGKDRTYGL